MVGSAQSATLLGRQNGGRDNGRETRGMSALEVRPVTPVIGAELFGVDLREPLDADTVRAIRDALITHQVIFFRDQDISESEQLRFAEYFGSPMLSVSDTLAAEQPKITVLDT